MKTTNKKLTKSTLSVGSALILAVVLTSLLAIIGVMFLMVARVDRMATSAISENKELDSAVETVVAKISQELVLDTPGAVDPNEEYYDYPDPCNAWLASLEPYEFGGIYYWRHISDIYDRFGLQGLGLPAGIINDYQSSTDVGDSNGYIPVFYPADADGDGVSDSMWVELDHMTSSKGKPIFAAIRIVDNSAILNVNTIFADPNAGDKRKGDMLTDIYIDGLVKLGGDQIFKFIENRSGDPAITEVAAQQYHIEVSRRVENPAASNPPYTLYDISEELSLRNRFVLHPNQTITRLEAGSALDPNRCLSTTLRWKGYGNSYAPYTTSDFESWKRRLNPLYDANEPVKSNYDFRHLLTNYSMDRIINPVGQFLNNGKMVNVNMAGKDLLYYAIRAGLYDADPNFAGAEGIAAQMAVNLKDYSDNDANVSTINVGGQPYYGFERPCIYISELAHNFVRDPNDPNTVYRSYAIELYKPYSEDAVTADWRIDVDGTSIDINSWPQTEDFYVIQNQDPNGVAILDVNSNSAAVMAAVINGIIRIVYINTGMLTVVKNSTELVFDGGKTISLERRVDDVNDIWILVDSKLVPSASGDWLAIDGNDHSIQRDITLHKCIRRLWDDLLTEVDSATLGSFNSYTDPSSDMIQAHPANADFTNIGEIGNLFRIPLPFNQGTTGADAQINLTDTAYQQIFNYLTVFDPTVDGIDNNGDGYGIGINIDPNELKIPGRININTAPWYVIAQLPWMQYYTPTDPNIADAPYGRTQAVCDYRDNILGGFRSTAELMSVPQMRSLRYDADDNLNSDVANPGPDFTDDSATNDFEEQDLIFSRISNLVTVRSDVFTAYILVRIGADGPQKRVIAVLDRSNVYSGNDKVRIVALHPVPDPR